MTETREPYRVQPKRLLIAYVGKSGAIERTVTPETAGTNWPEAARATARQLLRAAEREEARRDREEAAA